MDQKPSSSSEDRHSVTRLVADLKAGDEEAARKLWERFFDQLVSVARHRLGSLPRRSHDEEDLALSVFDSLCRGAEKGRFERLSDREDLWHLLLRITQRKTVDRIRHEGRQKRGEGKVRGESVFAFVDDENVGIDWLVGESPTPEYLTQVDEEYQQLLDSLGDETLKRVAVMRMEGYSNDDIADQLDVAVSTVERKLKRIRAIWSEELE